MKRKDMLDEITYILDVEFGELDHPSIAKLILNTCEKFGMLPPSIKEPCFCSSLGTCPTCSSNYFYSCKWEDK